MQTWDSGEEPGIGDKSRAGGPWVGGRWQQRILTSKEQGPGQGWDSSPQKKRESPGQSEHLVLRVLRCSAVFKVWLRPREEGIGALEVKEVAETDSPERAMS